LQKYFFATDLHGFPLIFKKFAQIREICGGKNHKINLHHDLYKSSFKKQTDQRVSSFFITFLDNPLYYQ